MLPFDDLLSTGEDANRFLSGRILRRYQCRACLCSDKLGKQSVLRIRCLGVETGLCRSFSGCRCTCLCRKRGKLLSGNYSYASFLCDADTLLVTASSLLDLEGSISFSSSIQRSTRVVLPGVWSDYSFFQHYSGPRRGRSNDGFPA